MVDHIDWQGLKETKHELEAGQRVIIHWPGDAAGEGDFNIDIRFTGDRLQVFVHSDDLCNGPEGCQPQISMSKTTEPEPRDMGLTEMLTSLYGIRPLSPKKNN